jgi:hypothetical protein
VEPVELDRRSADRFDGIESLLGAGVTPLRRVDAVALRERNVAEREATSFGASHRPRDRPFPRRAGGDPGW